MIAIQIVLNGEGFLEGTDPAKIIHLRNTMITVFAMEKGMKSGAPSVGFVFQLPSGETVLAETSMMLFQDAARAFAAKFGWVDGPRDTYVVNPKDVA
jgi:hypothetical protein